MTEPERIGLRKLIDSKLRERLVPPERGCSGCGTDLGQPDAFTLGCWNCNERRRSARRRALDPEGWRERDRAYKASRGYVERQRERRRLARLATA